MTSRSIHEVLRCGDQRAPASSASVSEESERGGHRGGTSDRGTVFVHECTGS